MEDIKKIVEELLTKEIGHHFLDSGGAYGYMYEKNRENGILKGLNPVDEYTNGQERTLEVTIPVYDFLTNTLIKDDITIGFEKQLFKDFEDNNINPYGIWEVQNFLNAGTSFMDIENDVDWVNTYNNEEFLSQTLQYALINNGYDWFVLLQVHNGCDVRSGYTLPALFKVKMIDEFHSSQFGRKTMCKCGLNDYSLHWVDEIYDDSGDVISKEDVFNRTYVDDEGSVRCRDCDSIVKGGSVYVQDYC